MRVNARQQRDFLEMLRQCESTLVKVCVYFTSRSGDDFRDLYQEIACILWESWPKFRGESNVSTWATRIALNVVGQEARRRKQKPQFVEIDEDIYETLADEATDLRYRPLYELIDKLKDDEDRKLLFLYLDRRRLREIAEITGLTEPAVRQKLYRIRQELYEIKRKSDEQ